MSYIGIQCASIQRKKKKIISRGYMTECCDESLSFVRWISQFRFFFSETINIETILMHIYKDFCPSVLFFCTDIMYSWPIISIVQLIGNLSTYLGCFLTYIFSFNEECLAVIWIKTMWTKSPRIKTQRTKNPARQKPSRTIPHRAKAPFYWTKALFLQNLFIEKNSKISNIFKTQFRFR